MEKLKPCPFCGDPMEWRKGGYASHIDPSTYCPIATQGFVFATPWNTRAEADTLRAEVERLRESLKEITQGYDPSHHGEIAEDMNAIALAALAHGEAE
jgi:hypothetical protein